jgi:hypothetical protein
VTWGLLGDPGVIRSWMQPRRSCAKPGGGPAAGHAAHAGDFRGASLAASCDGYVAIHGLKLLTWDRAGMGPVLPASVTEPF